jgi:hypothetical protein
MDKDHFCMMLSVFSLSCDSHLSWNVWFCFSTVRQQGQSVEKINRAMILAPLVGIVLNLRNASSPQCRGMVYDMATVLAGVDVSAAVIANFQYLVEYSWVSPNAKLLELMEPLRYWRS